MLLSRPVAFFDSGVGGLTAVAEFSRLMPLGDVLYFADTANMPCGNKSVNEIEGMAVFGLSFLNSFNPSAIVIACGTVGSVLDLRETVLDGVASVPIIRVIAPSCVEASKLSKKRRIGVMATSATVSAGGYRNALHKIDPAIEVCEEPCPELASFIENSLGIDSSPTKSFYGFFPTDAFLFQDRDLSPSVEIFGVEALNVKDLSEGCVAQEQKKVNPFGVKGKFPINSKCTPFSNFEDVKLVKEYLDFFCDKDIDVLILGCTHYPLIENYVKGFFEGRVSIISSSREVAKETANFLRLNNLVSDKPGGGNLLIYVSGDVDVFSKKAETILPERTLKKMKIEHISC